MLLIVAAVLILVIGRGSTFFRDDWNFILFRRGHSAETLLRPHNGHSISLQLILYKLLLQTAGLKTYVAYRAVSVVLHLLVAVLLFLFARRRVGPGVALAVTAVFVIPGAASEVALWPTMYGFLGSIAAGIGALMALERGDRRGDLGACVLLVVALASSGVGVAVVAASSVLIVMGRDPRARLVRVLAAPLLLYALWLLVYGGEVPPELVPATESSVTDQPLKENIFDAPRYVANAASTALAATVAVDSWFGPTLAIAAAALLALRLRRPGASPMLWALLAWALAYWGALALTRGQFGGFDASRYLYPGVAVSLLIGVEAMRGLRLSRRGLAFVAMAAAVVVVGNIGLMRDQGFALRVKGQGLLAVLTALELARDHVDPNFKPAPDDQSPAPDIVADRYFAAIDDFGSPAPSPAELAQRPDPERGLADTTLLQALRIQPSTGEPVGALGPAPRIVGASLPGARAEPGCVVTSPSPSEAATELRLSSPAVALRPRNGAAVELRARRFADTFGDPFATVAGGTRAVLRFPADRSELPWHLEIRAGQSVRACGLMQ